MRILLSAYAFDPDSGSEAGIGWNWAVHLARAGHDVWVLTGDPPGQGGRRDKYPVVPANLHIVKLPIPWYGRLLLHGMPGIYIHYYLWLRQTYKVGKRLFDSHRFHLVHHVSWGSIFFGSPLWRLPIPFVLGPVGGAQTTPPSLLPYLGRYRSQERLRTIVVRHGTRLNPLARRAVHHAAVVLVTNSATARQAQSLGARCVRLVADTAVPPAFLGRHPKPPTRSDSISILWLGRLLPRKGLPLALDALSRISPDVRWRCSIVGYGPLSSSVQAWLERYGISDRTTWAGRVPFTEISRAYEGADLFLFTSLRDSLGSQLYEASAFALPIVGLNHQGVADLLPDEVALKVPVGNPAKTAASLARAIEAVARDERRRRAMSEAAVRFAERNTWASRVKEVYAIIQSSLEEPVPDEQ